MASKTAEQTIDADTDADAHEQMFSDWVYLVPGIVLMVGSFAVFVLMMVL